jgi:hypothetical protein
MKLKMPLSLSLLLVVTSLFTAYKPKEHSKKLTGTWFEYIGPQLPGSFATLSDARTPLNFQFASSMPPSTGTSYLIAIFVQQSEIDDGGTVVLSDDLPKVDDSSTDIYTALALAKDPITGAWRSVTHNTATVSVGSQPPIADCTIK